MIGARGKGRAGFLTTVLVLLLAVPGAQALPRDVAAETGSALVLHGRDIGSATALTGDVDGDGVGDLAVMSPTLPRDTGRYETGLIHVVSGARRGEGQLDPALITILAPSSGRGRDLVVAAAGDVDGDGLSDVLVGAPDLRIAGVRRGAAYVVRGEREPRVVDLDAFDGSQADGFRVLGVTYAAGTSVDGIGDVDGDGLDDLAIGDPATYQGSVSIVHGRSGSADVDLAGAPPGVLRVVQRWGDPLGMSVAAAGDVNGDGTPDVVMTGEPMPPGTTENEIDPGGGYVLHGSARTGTVTVQDLEAGQGGFSILGFYRAAGDGVDASGTGDANGDGLADVAVAQEGAHAAFVVFGRRETTPVHLAALRGAGYRVEGGGGGGVAPAGDQDGDGRDDLLVTTHEDAGSGDGPNAFVVPGQTSGQTVDLRTFDGSQTAGTRISGLSDGMIGTLHRATSGGLDATGDDCADILVSAPGPGSAYLVAGSCAPSETAEAAPPTPADPATAQPAHAALPTPAPLAAAGWSARAAVPRTASSATGAGQAATAGPRLTARRRGARLIATAECASRGTLTVRWRRGRAHRRTVVGRRTIRLSIPRRARRAGLVLRCGGEQLTHRLRVRRAS